MSRKSEGKINFVVASFRDMFFLQKQRGHKSEKTQRFTVAKVNFRYTLQNEDKIWHEGVLEKIGAREIVYVETYFLGVIPGEGAG